MACSSNSDIWCRAAREIWNCTSSYFPFMCSANLFWVEKSRHILTMPHKISNAAILWHYKFKKPFPLNRLYEFNRSSENPSLPKGRVSGGFVPLFSCTKTVLLAAHCQSIVLLLQPSTLWPVTHNQWADSTVSAEPGDEPHGWTGVPGPAGMSEGEVRRRNCCYGTFSSEHSMWWTKPSLMPYRAHAHERYSSIESCPRAR